MHSEISYYVKTYGFIKVGTKKLRAGNKTARDFIDKPTSLAYVNNKEKKYTLKAFTFTTTSYEIAIAAFLFLIDFIHK